MLRPVVLCLFCFTASLAANAASAAEIDGNTDFKALCLAEKAEDSRIVCAEIGALDQTLIYNRFGSFNPFGMIFALDRDLAPLRDEEDGPRANEDAARVLSAMTCDGRTGAEFGHPGVELEAGNVRLKDCKRPRPLTLRVNVGDVLLVQVNNYLFAASAEDLSGKANGTVAGSPDFSSDYCKSDTTNDANFEAPFPAVSRGDQKTRDHGEAICPPLDDSAVEPAEFTDWPKTRHVNFVVQGLLPLAAEGEEEPHAACLGTGAVVPDGSFICKYEVLQEGTYFFASHAAPSGGEGNGGSLVHGLFGAIVAEREGTRWYRSQTSSGAFDTVWPRSPEGPRHARTGALDYEAVLDDDTTDGATPLLNMARPIDGTDQLAFHEAGAVEIVHGDLNAIIFCDPELPDADCHRTESLGGSVSQEPAFLAFREFSVFFHDETKAKYTKNFEELENFGQLAGVKDGFAINYGASGMGSILLANRKGIGPSSDCMECLYEEFFLTSWANGDPALLEWYADDPSNVHHSYLNDPVVFRNFHAGPKETHVFHLHAHQWFAGNDPSRGAYLDSQTVGPQQGFSYNIYHGGLRGLNGEGEGWWDTQGSGNRNRTLGDSIFHCHLYPHFAQGMWALWRVHDVLEDGTRKLPDGQPDASLSTAFTTPEDRGHSRPGSVDRLTGLWLGPETGDPNDTQGTPIPALIPLPGEALPLLPTYATAGDLVDPNVETPELRADAETPMPGFPFYIAGVAGHRPPQAPLDIARDLGEHDDTTLADLTPEGSVATALADTRVNGDGFLDGGLGRHVVRDGSKRKFGFEVFGDAADALANFDALSEDEKTTLARQVVAKAFALGDLSGSLEETEIERLPNGGTRLERAAMGFHFDGQLFEPGGDTASLRLADVTGTDPADISAAPWNGSIASKLSPLPGAASGTLQDSVFYVNGNAPKPGAPFADPCGATSAALRTSQAEGGATGVDPFVANAQGSEPYFRDPFLLGFRRYEVSAVQVDMVVNRAGWHDPQARINVLTAESDRFKDNAETDRISPLTSDTEEPFFFRAMSGECIEFRHTNELPKDLKLDDFQVKTPTDTIGQHIHLVKFDVMASDGSANGWNYEDGTFAPDELALRICTATDPALFTDEQKAICETNVYENHDIWRLERSDNRHLFQTTVQRWFADPILTLNGDPDTPQLRDRTLRTVFTHDHFAPSSIQQHGFYSALLIEPGMKLPEGNPEDILVDGAVDLEQNLASICAPDGSDCVGPIADGDGDLPQRLTSVAWGHEGWDGSQKRLATQRPDPAHPDFREFALSVADFALLYDPRDRTSVAELRASTSLGPDQAAGPEDGPLADAFGMSQLHCEAKWRLSPYILREICGVATTSEQSAFGTSWYAPGEWVPAWIAGGLNRDEEHKGLYFGDTFETTLPDPNAPDSSEVTDLFEHLVWYRQRAAGYDTPPGDETVASMAKPVAPPGRPESISVDHHDPYLVNYRGAPLPLRVGDKERKDGGHTNDCRLRAMGVPGDHAGDPSEVVAAFANAGTSEGFGECSVDRQLSGPHGDMAEVLRSEMHGDAETPVFEAYQNERLVFRLIQGAQEVQHTFNIAGLSFTRNIDQHYPAGAQPLDVEDSFEVNPTPQQACATLGRVGRPDSYTAWRDSPVPPMGQEAYWNDWETLLAECDNIEGFTFAQEIGISEHFEMTGSLRSDVLQSLQIASSATADADSPSDNVPIETSDYLYNFGSVDALWNGAWGLLRIYRDENSRDPSTVAAFNDDAHFDPEQAVVTASSKLGESIGAPEIGIAQMSAQIQGTGGLSCPLPKDGDTQKVLRSFVIAFETRALWTDGTAYGVGRYDPDGLMLAFLSPEQLGVDFEASLALSRQSVLDRVDAVYDAPQPMTLRVNAGDCVQLRYINAMTPQSDQGDLRDRLGDAPLPPITPLNVGRNAPTPGHGGTTETLPPAIDPDNPGGLRPSATLALSLALPGMDLANDLPLAYGYQSKGLRPGDGDTVTVSDPFLFYAGRMRLNLNFNPTSGEMEVSDNPLATLGGAVSVSAFEALQNDANPWLAVGGSGAIAGAQPTSFVLTQLPSDNEAPGIVTILGQPFALGLFGTGNGVDGTFFDGRGMAGTPLENADCWPDCAGEIARLVDALNTATTAELDARTHWIPYAFGAAPLRSTGDIVSHVQHGLFGSIDVVPRGWAAHEGLGQTEESCETTDAGFEICGVGYLENETARDGHAMVFDATTPSLDGQSTTEKVREFVLYFQDGLNLHDPQSRIMWLDEGGQEIVEGGAPLKIVPDCEVCDDSYDRGEKAVSYRAIPHSAVDVTPDMRIEASDDMNAFVFAPDFVEHPEAMRLRACEGERVVIRVVHPGGRARQRAFAMNGYSYDDLFPGFGFPRSALLAPGKSISAFLWPKAESGTYLWHDGPTHIRAGGVWGLLEVSDDPTCE